MRRARRYDWEDDVREGRALTRRLGLSTMGWIIVAVLFTIALSGLVWFIRVQTSEVKGAGDAQIITNDGRNRINAQETYHKIYNEILSLDERLTATSEQSSAATTPDDRRYYRQTLDGQISRCLEVVGQYNAATRAVSQAKWRDADLPYEIDQTDPATDCKPNTVPSPTR